jgi:hypothetical protein
MARLIPIALTLVSLSFHEAWATTPTAVLRAFFADAGGSRAGERAMRMASLLRAEKRLPPHRWPVVIEPGPTLARVRVGPFADRAEATSNLRALASRGFKPFIAEEGRDPR